MNKTIILDSLKKSVFEYNTDASLNWVKTSLEEDIDPLEVAGTLIQAIEQVGEGFKRNEIFLPELCAAANVLETVMPVVKKEIERQGKKMETLGTILIGTVFGDIHSIGKAMVVTMCKAAGFEVIDLGVNISAEKFIEAVRRDKPDILAMSALLTTTASEQKKVIEYLEKEGLREKIKVMVGGGAITSEFADMIGADGYSPTAPEAADLAKELLSNFKKGDEKSDERGIQSKNKNS